MKGKRLANNKIKHVSAHTDGKSKEESHDNITRVRGTERRQAHRDRTQDQAAVVEEKRVDLGEVGDVAAQDTSECVGDADD